MKIRVLRNLAAPHLRNAIRRHLSMIRLESENAGKPFGPFYDEILDDWISCILSCGAAADTFFNDFMKEKGLSESEQDDFKYGRITKRVKGFFTKYYNIKINIEAPVYKQMQVVYDLRSAVMHYRPHWSDEQGISQKLEQRMPRLKENRLFTDQDMFFPHRCASSDYSRWAVRTMIDFVKELIKLGDLKRMNESVRKLEEMFEQGDRQ